MKKFKFQKELDKAIKENAFLDGWFDSWQIWIQSTEFSLPKHYMQCDFTSEESAIEEMERIKVRYPKIGRELFHIEVRLRKVRRLKKPISFS